MRRPTPILAAAALLAAAVAAAGCGDTKTVQEGAVTVSGGERTAPAPGGGAAGNPAGVRIAVVTHGQASSKFWTIVHNGVEAGGRRTGRTPTPPPPAAPT